MARKTPRRPRITFGARPECYPNVILGSPEAVPRGSASGKRSPGSASRQCLGKALLRQCLEAEPREGAPEAVPRGSASGKRSRGSASRQRLVEASPEAVPRGSASGRRWSNKAPGFQKSPSPVQQSPLVILGCTPEWRKGHPPQTEWSFWGAPQNGGMVQQAPPLWEWRNGPRMAEWSPILGCTPEWWKGHPPRDPPPGRRS